MTKNKKITASEIGKVAWCPHGASIMNKAKSVPRLARQIENNSRVRQQGIEAHDALTVATIKASKTTDKRCFVASYALGEDHPATSSLRAWRDSTLLPSASGRLFVQFYYAVSPPLIKHLGSWRFFKFISQKFVLAISRKFAGYQGAGE